MKHKLDKFTFDERLRMNDRSAFDRFCDLSIALAILYFGAQLLRWWLR